ncbi:MAG TPA: cation-transporting P-type ATPase [Candidatus Baltobacteraceae bacterium]|nr:cation-transporting P-type ATPase [Candidatus Baltobacteraceae bacterium]
MSATISSVLAQGLSREEAQARLQSAGPNVLVPGASSTSALTWVLRLAGDPMVLLLAIAGGTYAALGDRFDAIIVGIALLPIFLVTSLLEYRSDRALERLNALAPPRASVIRDGAELKIPAREVVPGDLLVLREGDVIAADGEISQSTRLLVDESALTGESLPVEKTASGADRVLAGTVVRSGRAQALVLQTGGRTEYGRIGRQLATLRRSTTPIERAIHRVVFQVGIAVGVICILVVAIGRWHGDAWPIAVIAGVSLAMAAIPEELPMVYTLYLALGAWRLAKDDALVRRLSSVETLGATTVICVDKTGTLTYGKLAVESVFACEGFSEQDVLTLGAFASDPHSGDPIDGLLLAHVEPARLQSIERAIVPFDPAHRYSAALWDGSGKQHLAVKGAYEEIARRGGTQAQAAAQAFLRGAGGRGARVLAIAQGEGPIEGSTLQLAGLIAFADPVRKDAREAVTRCRAAGMRLVMITGDHPETAAAIARQAGLRSEGIATGEDLTRWSEAQLASRIDDIDVFARIRPEEKLRIVRALHARGEIVAMTGDGTNDALALRESDIGVAMGKGGTEVARAAADLVLLDDDVTTIVRAVADGRRIFANLRHAFSYLNAFHAPLLLSALVLPLLGAPLLLFPVHLIWLELIVHPTSALVFENDPPAADLMTSPPRNPRAPLIGAKDWRRALTLGISLAGAVLAVYLFLLWHGTAEPAARAAGLMTMIAGQTLLVFVERAGSRPLWSVSVRDNRSVLPIVFSTAASLAAAILVPAVAQALHLAPVPWETAAAALGCGAAAVLWTQPLYALRSARA